MTVTALQPNPAPTVPSARPRSDGDRDENGVFTAFAELLGAVQSTQGIGEPLPTVATTADPDSGGSRDARLALMRREDEAHRRSGPGRIAAVSTPQSTPARDAVPSEQNADAPAGAKQATTPESNSGQSAATAGHRPTTPQTTTTQFASQDTGGRQSPPDHPSSQSAPAESASPQIAAPQTPNANTASQPPIAADAPPAGAAKIATQRSDGAARARTQPQPNGITTSAQRGKDGARNAIRPGATEKASPGRTESPQRAAFDRITKLIQAAGGGKETTIRVALNPPGLGHVRVNVRLRNDVLTVRIAAENGDARRVLLSQSDDLKTSLEQHGIKVQRMDFPSLRTDGETAQPFNDGGSDPGEPSQSGAEAHGRGQENQAADHATGLPSLAETIDGEIDHNEPTGAAPDDIRLDVRV